MPYIDKNGVAQPGAEPPEDDEDLQDRLPPEDDSDGGLFSGAGGSTYIPTESPYADLDRTVLSRIEEGLQGPSDALQAMMRRGSEAVATRARQLEAAAGARAAKSGMIGQGSENTLADDVGRDILSTLAQQQQQNTIMAGEEQQKFLGMAQDALLAQQQQQQAYNATIGQLAASNPVLAAKFTQFMMAGGSGEIGDFTPEEQQQLSDWIAENKEMDALVKEELMARIQGLRSGEGGSAQQNAITSAIEAGDLSTLALANARALAENPTYLQQAKDAGLVVTPDVPESYDFVRDAFRNSSAKAKAKAEYQQVYAGLQVGGIIEKDGKFYRISEVGARDSKKERGNTRGRYVTKAVDLSTGESVDLYPSSWFDVD